MSQAIHQEIDRFLHTGTHDLLGTAWPGSSVVERLRCANSALRQALIALALDRSRHATGPLDFETPTSSP